MRSVRSSLLAILLAILVLPGVAGAAAKPKTAAGISISPFLQEVALQKSDTQKSFNLTLTNRTGQIQEIDLHTKDFGSLNETGGIILEGRNDYSRKYGLASWLSLEKDAVVLNPNESTSVLVTVENRQSLQPGGHYGAVVAAVNGQPTVGSNQVVLQQQLVSLVLATKIGGEHYDLKLASLHTNGNWFRLPTKVTLRFQNPGNVHVVPRGLVKLKAPGGKVIAQGTINTESAYVLPESFRELTVPLSKVGSSYPWPGMYQVEVDYRYEGIERYAVKNQPLQFISLGLYLVGAAVLIGLFLFVRTRRKQAVKNA